MKLMVMGYAGHGKDTVCKILNEDYGMKFVSATRVAAEKIIMPVMKYDSVEDCIADRVNHRKKWFDLISEYNSKDPARLIREVLKDSDIYCGVRSYREFNAARKERLFRCSVWVDASKRLPIESTESCTVNPLCTDYVLMNDGGTSELRLRLDNMMKIFSLVRFSGER